MITNRKRLSKRCSLAGTALTIFVLAAFFFLDLTAQAQVQRKTKGPKPPSYDEVLQRAITEKKSATNALTAAPAVRQAEPTKTTAGSGTLPQPVAQPVPAVATPTNQVKTPDPLPTDTTPVAKETVAPPKAVTVSTAAVSTTPVLPPPVASPAVRTETPPPASTTATSTTTATPNPTKPPAKSKGPVFSPLPPDLAPANVGRGTAPPVARNLTESTNAMARLDEKHLLAVGDRLSFRIVEDGEDPKSLIVADSGELEVPYIGRLKAEGKSCFDLAVTIKAELEKEYYYEATVRLFVDQMARSRGKVDIYGPVRLPGSMEIPSDEKFTLSKAILRAGGFTDFADKKTVKVTRKGKGDGGNVQTFTVNVAEILEKGRTEFDLPLEPGDLIYVEDRVFRL